ncbi:hypothetical protein J4731_10240 [Providencia rettgeri]|nr:hypothetical protein [Providencia rettgeri]
MSLRYCGTEYGSASLSEFDLDIVTTLDISRYSAPETLAGGERASDWWSLVILLGTTDPRAVFCSSS